MPAKTSPLIALQNRNFRLLWLGQFVSVSGSLMQSAAILWQVSLLVPANYKGLALGLVGLTRVIPIVVFSLLSGVVAYALDRRKLMLVTQTGMTLVAAALAALTFSGAADTVSTVLRNIIRQLSTPDGLRGRMVSVNMIFFMGGPQLGELEAGLVANWLGAPFSVVSGGVGCLLALAWVTWQTPVLRRYRHEPALPAAAGTPAAVAG